MGDDQSHLSWSKQRPCEQHSFAFLRSNHFLFFTKSGPMPAAALRQAEICADKCSNSDMSPTLDRITFRDDHMKKMHYTSDQNTIVTFFSQDNNYLILKSGILHREGTVFSSSRATGPVQSSCSNTFMILPLWNMWEMMIGLKTFFVTTNRIS